jgi:ribosome biogenesis GTPase / thiamine phosphate phosphatase
LRALQAKQAQPLEKYLVENTTSPSRKPAPATGSYLWLAFYLTDTIEIIGITAMKTNNNELYRTKHRQNNKNKASSSLSTGIVFKRNVTSYIVQVGERTVECKLASELLKNSSKDSSGPRSKRQQPGNQRTDHKTSPAVVGDRVRVAEYSNGDNAILEVLPRRNKLSRRAPVSTPSAVPIEQVIVANVDRMTPVFAAAFPTPKWNLLDRYLALAESLDLPVTIAITKLDLATQADGSVDQDLLLVVTEYRRIGYPVVMTSAVTGTGTEEIREHLQGGLSVFMGKSGVGKTALLNSMQPGLGLRVNEVSQATGKGKHTTTHMEIFPLDTGGAVIDTPGVREFGLWDMDGEELAYFYREMRPLIGLCRFGLDCGHDEEPGCAIRKAVASGEISPRRYQSYLRLKEELGAP